MIILSKKQYEIMLTIGKYKFLTATQLQRLGLASREDYIRRVLRQLYSEGFVKALQYGTFSKGVKSHKLNYLTPKGAKVVSEAQKDILISDIKYPKSNNSMVKNDFDHRISTISTEIAFNKWTENNKFEIVFWDNYFDTVGSNRNKELGGSLKPKTRIETDTKFFVDPDSIFSYKTKTNQHLCMLEIHNGNDTKRIVEKIKSLAMIINQGYCSEKYNIQKNAKAMIVFENETNLTSTIKRLDNEPMFQSPGISNYFYFSLAEEIHKDFNTWVKMTGEVVQLHSL